ncbi:cytochrome P450, partial [Lasiosphaeria hispida]
SIAWSVVLYPKLFSPPRKLPGPKCGSFFNGQLRRILENAPGVPMEQWINSIPNDGMIRFTIALNAERILLTSPAAISDVLIRNVDAWQKPEQLRQSLAQILRNSLVVAEGASHRAQRKNMMPAFGQPRIRALYPTFWKKSCDAAEAICAQISRQSSVGPGVADGGAEISFSDWLRRITLDNIGEAGFGYRFDAISDPESEVNRTY